MVIVTLVLVDPVSSGEGRCAVFAALPDSFDGLGPDSVGARVRAPAARAAGDDGGALEVQNGGQGLGAPGTAGAADGPA